MIESSKLLRSYVSAIHRLSGARTVSLYVPGAPTGLWQPILVHEGSSPPVPELADLATAGRFHTSWYDAEPAGAEPQVESESPVCRLVRVPNIHSLATAGSVDPAHIGRRKLDAVTRLDASATAWVGLRMKDPDEDGKETGALDAEHLGADWWSWLLALGGALALHVQVVSDLLDDPVTGLPDRAELQAHLSRALHLARESRTPATLVLLNPDDFAAINERFGRERGDEVLRAVADRLRDSLRDDDFIGKYGGAVFAAILPGARIDESRKVADKILDRLTQRPYLDGALRLSFSLGMAGFDPVVDGDELPLGLMRRADQALNQAKCAGGGSVAWQRGTDDENVDGLDRMSGIFTANMAKDYRNMVLLWDTVSVVAKSPDFDTLAVEVSERLFATFKPERVALFRWTEDDRLQLVHGIERDDPDPKSAHRMEGMLLTNEARTLLREARQQARPLESTFASQGPGDAPDASVYAVPLIVEDRCLGSLYLTGRQGELKLDESDLIFLRALGGQLAVALDRARLSQQEQRRLRSELNQLRSVLQHSKLVYRSPQMESVLALVRRVAPTDATVLVTGESGTGKEMMGRTIHELSSRRKGRFEVVDCSTIAPTLIESELFGHERGAYTGAQQRKEGRLVLADGGTVVLDEIGELPLEIQGRLLRFVQEKQVMPVGGTRSKKVDVRVVAATNRDLSEEVARGRFREDLYYRLNVVRVELPPLRERPDDILYLANHFLKSFALQYQKPVQRLSQEAEAELLAYPWPGNIRELENRLMQATILSEGEELGVFELGLHRDRVELPEPEPQTIELSTLSRAEAARLRAVGDQGGSARLTDAPSWERLQDELRQQVERSRDAATVPALGRLLEEDFVLEAYDRVGRVSARAAKALGIAETTFRRKHRKARRADAGHARPEGWETLRSALRAILEGEEGSEDRLERAKQALLSEVLRVHERDRSRGSSLMGVSPPTFRRWLADRELAQVS